PVNQMADHILLGLPRRPHFNQPHMGQRFQPHVSTTFFGPYGQPHYINKKVRRRRSSYFSTGFSLCPEIFVYIYTTPHTFQKTSLTLRSTIYIDVRSVIS